jgi:hypothetical protein
MSLHVGLQNSHHDSNNVHQNELERNSMDVDNPHYNWQIGSRLKSCAVIVAPPPWCIGGILNSHLRSMHQLCALLGRRVASRREILSPMKKYMPSAKERSFLTVRMREKLLSSSWRWRRVVATDLRPHHLLLDPSLGTPACRVMRERREVLQQGHGMQCKNTSAMPSGRETMLASFRRWSCTLYI